MLRAPICTTSAYSWMTSACCVSSSSVTTGRPVSVRASARISSPATPRPLNANGDVRGLNAPPRSMAAPAALTARATSSVCSRDSTVHGPAIRQKVRPPPTRRPATSSVVGSWWLSSLEASLYGREIGTTRSTPLMPSSPSSATPSGSPMAPMAVVSSPGITTTCTPVVARRSRTASTSASPAPGVMTIITRRDATPGAGHTPAWEPARRPARPPHGRFPGMEATHTLLHVRPVTREDRARVAEMYGRLSRTSRYQRFLHPKPHITDDELTFFTDVDHVRHEALAAVDPRDGSFVGIARYATLGGGATTADLA